jgi:alpha-beta hydrolase superfamily lysophospholipase
VVRQFAARLDRPGKTSAFRPSVPTQGAAATAHSGDSATLHRPNARNPLKSCPTRPECVTLTRKSVTHVLTQKCYLCSDRIVFSHGNTGSIGHHLGFVIWLVDAGYNVLMYDYRGFGKSGGMVDRRGMVNDVKAAFTYTSSRADVDAGNLVSYGHSLGGAKSVTAIGESPSRDCGQS